MTHSFSAVQSDSAVPIMLHENCTKPVHIPHTQPATFLGGGGTREFVEGESNQFGGGEAAYA